MTGRGWSAAGLPAVGDDETLWTVAEAACHLGPPVLTVVEVRNLVRLARIDPVGKRRTTSLGQSGRYARVYRAVDLIKAYEGMHQIDRSLKRIPNSASQSSTGQ